MNSWLESQSCARDSLRKAQPDVQLNPEPQTGIETGDLPTPNASFPAPGRGLCNIKTVACTIRSNFWTPFYSKDYTTLGSLCMETRTIVSWGTASQRLKEGGNRRKRSPEDSRIRTESTKGLGGLLPLPRVRGVVSLSLEFENFYIKEIWEP